MNGCGFRKHLNAFNLRNLALLQSKHTGDLLYFDFSVWARFRLPVHSKVIELEVLYIQRHAWFYSSASSSCSFSIVLKLNKVVFELEHFQGGVNLLEIIIITRLSTAALHANDWCSAVGIESISELLEQNSTFRSGTVQICFLFVLSW